MSTEPTSTSAVGSPVSPNSPAQGFDCDSQVSIEQAQYMSSHGYQFAVRYVALSDGTDGTTLTSEEVQALLNAGLALMPVQHVAKSEQQGGWTPSAELGARYGTIAAINCQNLGLPTGINLWCDLEAVTPGVQPAAVSEYCEAWYSAVAAADYLPGLYVGSNSVLSTSQFDALPFSHYWKSESAVPTPPTRGFQMIQTLYPKPVYGLGIDKNSIQSDNDGDWVVWCAPEGHPGSQPPPAGGGSSTSPNPGSYTVEAGDTLSGIAQRFGTTVRAIARLNHIPDEDVIHTGEVLKIPVQP